jgi:beta-xylosidase
MKAELAEGEYAIRAGVGTSGDGALYIAVTTYRSAYAAMEYLMKTYYTVETGLCIPADLDVKGIEKEYTMITADINKLRDPCIVIKDGIYYAYGTGWHCYKNTGGNLQGPWKDLGVVASVANPDMDGGDHWAPEVHAYNGAYYMVCSYYSSQTGHRGSTVLRAASPTGPFTEISDGHITPHNWDCIDATLFVDRHGQPWLVFVHEWTCTDDGIGRMAVAKLSDDLTHMITEPKEIFRADSPAWTNKRVTDGCFLRTLADGKLIMLWSNFDEDGYCIALAHSQNGEVDGIWEQETVPLYKRGTLDGHDGGHGMVFTDVDGKQYICCHSPNKPCETCRERTVLIPVREENGTLAIHV